MKPTLLALAFALLLSQPLGGQEETLAPKEWKEFVAEIEDKMEHAEKLSGISIPLLSSETLEKRWGPPIEIRKSADGGYSIRFKDPDPDHPFEVVNIVGTPVPIPRLASVPDEMVLTSFEDDLRDVPKPQSGKSVSVKWKTPEGKAPMTIRYFRRHAGSGADGPIDQTDSFSLTVAGRTGYYVVTVETITDATEKRLKALSVE